MANIEYKKSVFRVLSDLIKSDNIISASEMDKLDAYCDSYDVSEDVKVESCSITLSAAASYIASTSQKNRDKVLKMMEELAFLSHRWSSITGLFYLLR